MDYREFTYEIMEILRRKRHPIEDIREFEQGENGILQALLVNERSGGESLSPGDLSAIQELSTGRIAATLKSLENKLYLERKIDSKDRRRITVTLTQSGRQLAQELFKETTARLEKAFQKIGEQDTKEFVRILKRLIDVYE